MSPFLAVRRRRPSLDVGWSVKPAEHRRPAMADAYSRDGPMRLPAATRRSGRIDLREAAHLAGDREQVVCRVNGLLGGVHLVKHRANQGRLPDVWETLIPCASAARAIAVYARSAKRIVVACRGHSPSSVPADVFAHESHAPD